MKHTINKFFAGLMLLTGSAGLKVYAQNTPNSQTAPAGNVTEPHTEPPATTNPGIYNYTRSFVPKIPITDASQVNESSPASNVGAATTYTDGFQRPMLSIQHHANWINGSTGNIVQPIDTRFQNSNDACSYLPYASDFGLYDPGAFDMQANYYNVHYPNEGSQAFSKTKTLSDAGTRKSTSYAPGLSNVGQGRGTTNQWITNATSEVRMWKLGTTATVFVDAANFTSGTQGWLAYNGVGTGTVQVANESGRLKITNDGPWKGAQKVLTVTSGKQYKLTIDIDKGNLTNTVQFTIKTNNGSGYVNLLLNNIAQSVNGYTVTFTAPSSDMKLLIEADGNNVASGFIWYLDNYLLEEVQTVANGMGLPASTAFYPAATLTGDLTTNTSGAEVYSYSDKAGRPVAKTMLLNTVTSGQGVIKVYGTTYYIYDELGRLRYVLPPKATDLTAGGTITQTQLDNLCYQYTYDEKGQKITQKVPGKALEEYVYDKRGRLVMYRDGTLKGQNKWLITFYDALDRVTVTSTIQSSATWATMNGYVNDAVSYPNTSFLYYIKNYDLMHVYPASYSGGEMLSYTYYDDYSIADPGDTLWNTYVSTLQFTELQNTPGAETPSKTLRTRGLVTGHKVRLIPAFNAVPSKVGDWKQDVIFYDEKARPIYTVSKDFYQGSAIHESYSGTQYDFSGKTLVSKHMVKTIYGPTANQMQTELVRNIYDANTSQLTSISHKVNSGGWKPLVSYEYDELGKIKREVFGNSGEVRDYTYNLRGQLTGINGEYAETGNKDGYNRTFGESLKYDYGFSQPKYDGNVAGMIWRGSTATNGYAYGYGYDHSGRLTTADFRQRVPIAGGGYVWMNTAMDYTVSNLTYDKGGNILTMNQRGVQPGVGPVNMDVLSYNYENSGQSNRLQYVNDGGVTPYGAGDFNNVNTGTNDYTYDVNGNITSDLNKGISSVSYTIWNKPLTVLASSGTNWQYSYDGLGKKLQERYYTATGTTVTDYVDNFIYKNDTLQYILTPVGRTLPDGKEEFFVKDHLGNIRSTIDVTTYVMQEYLASFEIASANLEGLFFDNIDEVRDENPSSTDPNNEYSARLNGGDPGHEIGASLLMKVMTGDHINVNVNNFYEGYQQQEDVPLTVNDMLGIIVTTLKAGNGGWTGSESHNTNLVDRLFTPSNYTALQQIIDNTASDPSKPKAYLNYILFDEHMNIVPEMSGAYQANGNGTWTGIGTGTAKTIPTNGYFAVFLTNKSKITGCLTCGDVFFDQLVVQVNKSNLLEENAYYPYGLPIKGLSGTAFGFKQNKYKYQGNEYTEQGLNWMDFHNRQYDPQIGRFLSVDPLAASTARFSPFTGMIDNPVSMVDPLGLSPQNMESYFVAKLGDQIGIPRNPKYTGPGPDTYAAFDAFNRDCANQAFAYQRQMVWRNILGIAVSMQGEAHYFSNGQYTGTEPIPVIGKLLPQIDVKGGHADYLSWGRAMENAFGGNNPLPDDFMSWAYDMAAVHDPWIGAAKAGYMPWNPEAMTISIPMGVTYGMGYSGSLDLTIASDGIGMGFTAGAAFGTPYLGIGLGISFIDVEPGYSSSIENLVGGDGTAFSGGVGPFSLQYSQSYNATGAIISKSYGFSLDISTRDFNLPVSASANPLSRQFPIFKWKFRD